MISSIQLGKLRDIIQKYSDVLMELTVGGGKSDNNKLLRKLGVPRELRGLVTTSYQYGKLSTVLDKRLDELTEEEIEELIEELKFLPSQARAVEYANTQAGNFITNLNSKLHTSIVNGLLDRGIQGILSEGLEENRTRSEVARMLREYTEDYARDWNRVAHTEMWNAKLYGEVSSIINNESPLTKEGGRTMVFKRPAGNACNHCKKLYLEDDGLTPKLFVLNDLIANGTNKGRKSSDWLAVVGTVHPNCMCTISIMPPGCHFDELGQIELD